MAGVSYTIQSVTDLLKASNAWQYEGTIVGSYLTNWTPLSVAQYNRTNLFIRLRSELSSDGSSIPDWWEAQYGLTNVDPEGQDSAGDGYTVYQKYELGVNPSTWTTPRAPQGLTVAFNATSGIASLQWLSSPGNVTGYTVEKSYTYAWSNTVQDFSASVASYSDNVSANCPNPWQAGTISVSYTVQAHYAGGNSALSPAVPLEAPSFAGSINSNPEGSVVLTIAAMPANTTGIRLTEIDWFAIDDDDFADAYVTNFVIAVSNTSSLTLALANVQTPNSDFEYAWEGQAIQADGNESAIANVDRTFEGKGNTTALMEPPFYDERVLLKQNLIFQLRAVALDTPLHFSIPQTNSADESDGPFGAYVGDYQYPQGYAYAGSYQFANFTGSPNYGVLDPFLPSEENCLFRNLVFTTGDVDENGTMMTGVGFGTGIVGVGSPNDDPITLMRPLAYVFQTNWTTFPALLDTNIACWTFYDGTGKYDGLYYNNGVVFDYDAGGVIMTNNLYNWFGLHLISATVAYNDYDTGNLATNIVLAGSETILPPDDISSVMPNNIYAEAEQPKFRTKEYDFWNPNPVYNANSNIWVYPLPGAPGFSTTNQTALFIAGVGSQIQIAGYAKLEVTNSAYTGVYAYLGQYFEQSYTMTNGVATSTNTGILSPYGNFLATQPGEVALVTMPDVDTGLQGTCAVYCVSLNVDKNHDGSMDLSFNGSDATSANSPFEFWVNNGNDQVGTFGDLDSDAPVPSASPNYVPLPYFQYGSITCQRDLENFARLWICGTPVLTTNYQVTLSWTNVNGSPAINLYNSIETNGGIGYLTQTNIAFNQCLASASGAYLSIVFTGPAAAIASITPSSSFTFPESYFTNGGNKFFLFEGAGVGSGRLTLTISQNSNIICQTSAYLDLQDVEKFYEQAVITNNYTGAISNWNGVIQEVVNPQTTNASDPDVIVFVHGINVPYWNWLDDGDTVFKRLYWSGYQGKFAAVKWPCHYLTPPDVWDASIFNVSELEAYKASTALISYLSQTTFTFTWIPFEYFCTQPG
jgi:hypothetical protein